MLIPQHFILEQRDKEVTLAVDYGTQQVTLQYKLRTADGEDGILTVDPNKATPLLIQGIKRADVLNAIRDWEHAVAKENVALKAQNEYQQATLEELQRKLAETEQRLQSFLGRGEG